MTKLNPRTLIGSIGGMLIVLVAAALTVWDPFAYAVGPGCLAIGYFYWRLSDVVAGIGLKILRIAWPVLGLAVAADLPGTALIILAAAVALGAGNLAVSLQPSLYPLPVWIGSLISLVVPLLAVTAGLVYVVGAPTVGDVATNSGVGFAVATTGLVAAHGIGVAIAAFGTDRVIAAETTENTV